MSDKPDYYDFIGIRLFSAATHIEEIASGREYTPSKNHRNLLFAMVKNAPRIVLYEDLWKEVWRVRDTPGETDLRNIQTTKGSLIAWFSDNGLKAPAVEAVPGRGYRLLDEVTLGWFENDPTPSATGSIGSENNHNAADPYFGENDFGSGRQPFTGQSPKTFPVDNKVFSRSAKRMILGLIFVLGIAAAFYFLQRDFAKKYSSPRMNSVEFASEAIAHQQCFLRISGENLNAETVALKVVGPGCGSDNPCTVANGALRLYGRISTSLIDNAPVTLAPGEYRLWLENDPGNPSNNMALVVPENSRGNQ